MRVFTAILVLALASTANAAPEDEGEAARRGLEFMLKVQLPVGGWVSDEYGLTSPGHKLAITAVGADAVLSVETSPRTLEAARKAVGFMNRYAAELDEGKINDGFDFNAWGAAYGLVHLKGLVDRWPEGEEPPDVKPLIDRFLAYAAKRQMPCGGWDYRTTDRNGQPLKNGSIAFLTGVMVDGLRLWKADQGVLDRALADLARCVDKKGVFCYSQDGDYKGTETANFWPATEAAGRSVQCQLALVEAGRAEPKTLLPRLELFMKVRGEFEKVRNAHPHTKPHMIAGYYYYHGHYYSMRAARRLLTADPTLNDKVMGWVEVLKSALLREQDADGHWIDAICGGKPYATALALLEIAEMREMLVPWHSDLDEALAKGREEGRLVVLLFTDDNEASQKLVACFYEPEFRELLDRLVLVRLDYRENKEIARRAKVYRAPSTLLLDASAEDPLKKPRKKLAGGRKPDKLRSLLEKTLGEK